MERCGVPVLCVLDQEDHQKRDDRRSGVDDELPGVREAEVGPEARPDDDHPYRNDERPRRAEAVGGPAREIVEEIAHALLRPDLHGPPNSNGNASADHRFPAPAVATHNTTRALPYCREMHHGVPW